MRTSILKFYFNQKFTKFYLLFFSFLFLTICSSSGQSIRKSLEIVEYEFKDEQLHIAVSGFAMQATEFKLYLKEENLGGLHKSSNHSKEKDGIVKFQFDLPKESVDLQKFRLSVCTSQNDEGHVIYYQEKTGVTDKNTIQLSSNN